MRCWRRLHNKELHNLYTLPNIIRVIESRRMRWARYVACMRETINSYKTCIGKLEEKTPCRRHRH